MIGEHSPQLVLLDLMLAEHDGVVTGRGCY